ncbi:MAG: ACP S-malonyltransferase, partial [Alphaproteobacteria bacterium]
MITILFPGQGAQYKGMGRDLFSQYPEQTEMASDILGYSIERLCIEDDEGKLRLTQYTQPALYVVNALNYLKRQDEGAPPPTYAAGHSLGEYNALLAAGVFDFKTGLQLVKRRGELMGAAKNGSMAAVIGIDEDSLTALLKEHQLSEIDLANFNTLSQIVIAGPKESILKAEKLLSAQNIRCVVLNVSAAFHSRYMKEAQQDFSGFLKQFHFNAPLFPVIANATARPYRDGETAEMLARQIASPVRWTDTIRYLMGKGCTQFVEMGGGIILTRMVEEIKTTATPLVVPEDTESVAEPEPQPEPAPEPEVTEKQEAVSAQPNGVSVGAAAEMASALPAVAVHDASLPLTPAVMGESLVAPEKLGSAVFRERFGLKYAYASGGM